MDNIKLETGGKYFTTAKKQTGWQYSAYQLSQFCNSCNGFNVLKEMHMYTLSAVQNSSEILISLGLEAFLMKMIVC